MYENLKEKALLLPRTSGVYIMEDKDGTIIYIGKAKILPNRVSQYFSNLNSHSEKTLQMVARVATFRVVITRTEFDALLLESQLIKQHKPKYNILLKDDKGYPFVRLGNEDYPKFTIENRKQKDKARYFGPYFSRGQAAMAVELAQNIMKLPTCGRIFPRDFGKGRPCLNFHMEKCLGFCQGNIEKELYDSLLHDACQILEGKYEGLLEQLGSQMEQAAEGLEFEKAAQLRDTINMVKKLGTGQGVFSKSLVDTDVLAYYSHNRSGVVVKMSYLMGTLLEKETVFFDGVGPLDGGDILESFTTQYYEAQGFAPRNLLISEMVDDVAVLEDFLSGLGRKTHIFIPQKGEKHLQVMLAEENARKEIELREKLVERTLKSQEQLAELLGVPKAPNRIEAFDISHTAGDQTVGAMVVFEGGRPAKRHYKHFKVNNAISSDDYGAMAEVTGRRLDRALSGDSSFLPLPDLLLIDGGKGQVSVVEQELRQRGLDIPIYGMVKDDKHRTRELTNSHGNLLGIDTLPPLFAFITNIQDEVHRFAIDYHKKLRSSRLEKSILDQIDGIGQARKLKLLKHFKTISAIKKASQSELEQVVPGNVAQRVYSYFNAEKGQ